MIVQGSGPHIVKYLQDRVESLKEKLDLAQARIDELEKVFGSEDELKPLWDMGLGSQESRTVHLLMRRESVTKEQILYAIYADDPARMHEVTSKVADVVFSKAKRRMHRFGVTLVGPGAGKRSDCRYFMPGPDKARLARLIASGARMVVRGRPDRKHYRKQPRIPHGAPA